MDFAYPCCLWYADEDALLSETIPSRPKLRVFTTSEMTMRQAKEGFKEALPRIQREAAKYGWVVEEELQI